MMQEIYTEFEEYNKSYDSKKEKLERLICRHEQSLKKLEHSQKGWVDRVLIPLANRISSELGGLQYEIYGPFGLSCETSVYFFLTGHDITKDETYNLTVYPGGSFRNGFHLMYDTGRCADIFAPGTIGYVNGLNKIKEPIPDRLEEIMSLLRHNHAR